MRVQSYLNFNGRCDEALEFYRKALGATVVTLMRFKDSPDPRMVPPGLGEMVMHASFRIGETELMASDGRCQGDAGFQGVSLALSVREDNDAERIFAALSEGGQVQMPLSKTFFASKFGMLADRFGVTWMVLAAPAAAGESAAAK